MKVKTTLATILWVIGSILLLTACSSGGGGGGASDDDISGDDDIGDDDASDDDASDDDASDDDSSDDDADDDAGPLEGTIFTGSGYIGVSNLGTYVTYITDAETKMHLVNTANGKDTVLAHESPIPNHGFYNQICMYMPRFSSDDKGILYWDNYDDSTQEADLRLMRSGDDILIKPMSIGCPGGFFSSSSEPTRWIALRWPDGDSGTGCGTSWYDAKKDNFVDLNSLIYGKEGWLWSNNAITSGMSIFLPESGEVRDYLPDNVCGVCDPVKPYCLGVAGGFVHIVNYETGQDDATTIPDNYYYIPASSNQNTFLGIGGNWGDNVFLPLDSLVINQQSGYFYVSADRTNDPYRNWVTGNNTSGNIQLYNPVTQENRILGSIGTDSQVSMAYSPGPALDDVVLVSSAVNSDRLICTIENGCKTAACDEFIPFGNIQVPVQGVLKPGVNYALAWSFDGHRCVYHRSSTTTTVKELTLPVGWDVIELTDSYVLALSKSTTELRLYSLANHKYEVLSQTAMISDAYTRCDLNDWAASGFLSDFPFASAFSVDGKYVAFLEKWSDAEKFGDLVVRSISNQTEVFRQRGVNQFLWLPNTSGLVYVIGYPATSDHVSENGGFLKRF